MKKFRSNLYTKEKIVLRDHRHQYKEDENGYLFAQGTYPTKIKAEDLPEWYVYGRYYKWFGYLSAKGVVDMKYVPSKYSNHFLKDDFLSSPTAPRFQRNLRQAVSLMRTSAMMNGFMEMKSLAFLKLRGSTLRMTSL